MSIRRYRFVGIVRRVAILAAIFLTAGVGGRAAEPSRDAAVDIGRFARVVTSDPNRMVGTAASRLQEFPAEDVFLETELLPADGRGFVVPPAADGRGCIGLLWSEMRHFRALELHWGQQATPPAGAVQLQYWVGESTWQGQWKPLPAKLEQSPGVWRWQIADKDQPEATVRVRWVFPASKEPIVVKGLSTYGRASWRTTDLRVELRTPRTDKSARIGVYNGMLLGAAQPGGAVTQPWDLSQTATVKVRYSEPGQHKKDRTVLRFELPEQTISVAVEDVLAHGCVYVPQFGLFVTTDPAKTTLARYLEEIAKRQTVLQRVRQLPDQDFARAMKVTHHPIQNQGPMLASLACDNRKYVVGRDGTIRFYLYDEPDGTYAPLPLYYPGIPSCLLAPRFGGGKGEVERHLDGDWLPKPVMTVTEDGLRCRQCVYVAPVDEKAPAGCPNWYRQRAVCVSEFTIENTRTTEATVSLALALTKDDEKTPATVKQVEEGLVVVRHGRIVAFFDAGQSAPLKLAGQPDAVRLTGKLAGGKTARLVVYLPAWPVKPDQYAVLRDEARWAVQTQRYWTDVLAEATQIDIPDRRLADVIRASQVHCLLATRNEDRGRYVAPWAAAMVYGPLESESQSVIRGMDMCGHADFARRGLDYFLNRYNSQGFLTTGYTLVGTGEHLWTLAEHYARWGDREWLEKAAPRVAAACNWISRQREKTKRLDLHGDKLPEFGLMPPGVSADWNRFGYRYFNDTQFCHGAEAAAEALAAIDYPGATAQLADAKGYHEDLLRAYRWTQARCPVVALADGTWVTNHPAMLDVFGTVEEMVPAEDGMRCWAYSVELGTHHMAANRLIDPKAEEVASMMDYLEDYQFLRTGMGDYHEDQNRKDFFCFGGFAKVQPFYARNAEVYALRDDVKPFLRSYFNAVSTLLNEENLSLWEHFHNQGAWNKTHETGWFLCQTAMMFALERGDELWLAPMTPNRWLQDGRKIEVRGAPTRFGKVSYSIVSSAAAGHIDAEIQPPTREAPRRLVLRLRHPEGKPIRAVTVDGKLHQDFDPRKECIVIQPTGQRVTVRAEY
jgi:hypothetical protein